MGNKEKLREIIVDNNFLATDAGQRFKDMYGVNYLAVISFAGRSRKHKSWEMSSGQYVTHLVIDCWGEIRVVLGDEDTDDLPTNLGRSKSIDFFTDAETKEWVTLLDW